MPPLLFFGTSCRYGRVRAFFSRRDYLFPGLPVWSYWWGLLGGQGRLGGKEESRALCFESSRRTWKDILAFFLLLIIILLSCIFREIFLWLVFNTSLLVLVYGFWVSWIKTGTHRKSCLCELHQSKFHFFRDGCLSPFLSKTPSCVREL